jgi:hypothetical protein
MAGKRRRLWNDDLGGAYGPGPSKKPNLDVGSPPKGSPYEVRSVISYFGVLQKMGTTLICIYSKIFAKRMSLERQREWLERSKKWSDFQSGDWQPKGFLGAGTFGLVGSV